jgi:MoaA/NifB/PqqE/SkfB family radical SAM enzyme
MRTLVESLPQNSYFELVQNDIVALYKTPEEVERVRQIFARAEDETRRKEIHRVRPPHPLKKLWARWYVRIKYGIHWRKRFYFFRLLRGYVLSFLYKLFRTDKHVFRGIEFGLTFKCNFKCHHCLCARIDETETKKEMVPDEYERVVKEAMKLGAHTFGLEGGEPFVFKNWEEVIRRLQPRYNHIEISTNAYLLDEERAQKCARLGVDTVNISLDSGIPELHDVFRRRRGSFERVLRAIAACRKNGIKVILNTVVHKSNLYTEGLIRLFEFSEKNRLLINVLFAKGVGAFKEKNEMLTDEDFAAFFKIAAPYNYWHIHHWGKLKSNHGGEGCSGVKEFVNMTPYGDVINCANNHIYLGNIREESFTAIRARALRQSPFGQYRHCFLTRDKDFMKIYYPLLEEKGWISLEEFREALRKYELQSGRKIYPELN